MSELGGGRFLGRGGIVEASFLEPLQVHGQLSDRGPLPWQGTAASSLLMVLWATECPQAWGQVKQVRDQIRTALFRQARGCS